MFRVPNNSSQLAQLASYLNTPVTTYTHTTNKEVVISAVDVGTDTFTSVGHGLVNGDIIQPIINVGTGNIFPIDKYPGGISYIATGYYVINKTNDTFQVSLTSGGAAVDLTTNANMDLTKWHFEVVPGTVVISNLNFKKCKLSIKGRFLGTNAFTYIYPNAISATANIFAKTGIVTFTNAALTLQGDINVDNEVVIDYTKYLHIYGYGTSVKSSSSSALSAVKNNISVKSNTYYNDTITSINFLSCFFANGTVVEVYKA